MTLNTVDLSVQEPAAAPDTDATTVDLKSTKDQAPTQTPAEIKARADGWKSEDEWGDDAAKPAECVSAEIFNERGIWISKHKDQQRRMDEMEVNTNKRIDQQRKMMEGMNEARITELTQKRDDAIDDADREKANNFQDQIDTVKSSKAEEPKVANHQTEIDNWNSANPWILGTDPKAAYAKQQCAAYQNNGMSVPDAIAAMEKDINKHFPDVNPQRDEQPLQEKGTKPGVKRAAAKLGMGDLTADEKKYYLSMPSAWKSEAEFLQTVQDCRGES